MSNDARIKLNPDGTIWEDPSLPPEPLVHGQDGKGGCAISFREGGRIELRGREFHPPKSLFMIALVGSVMLGGQPLRCSGLVPGVSLRIEVKRFASAGQFDLDEYAERVWQLVQPTFDTWFADPRNVPGIEVEIETGGVAAQFARDAFLQLRPGVMQIDVTD